MDEARVEGLPRTKHELAALPPVPRRPIERLPAEINALFIGHISSVIVDTVVIASDVSAHSVALDEGSVVVLDESRVILGEIFEVFGPVRNPFYSIRFSCMEELQEYNLSAEMRVLYVPAKAKVLNPDSMVHKGSDASNLWDEEPSDRELEFSDDEQETLHKQKRKRQHKPAIFTPMETGPAALLYEALPRPPAEWNPPY